MKLRNFFRPENSAQAIVEFAIALPVLLLLLYGLLETGRYLFLYSTVVNASRQAVRYGSATGIGNNGVPRYQDCQGIKAAANTGAYVASFDAIRIYYDSGPSTTQTEYCQSGNSDTSFVPSTNNNSRISVVVEEQYTPIVPRIVPFVSNLISAKSSRTILLSVSIVVTSPPTLSPVAPTATGPSPTSTQTPSRTPTNTPTFTPTRTNTPITHTATMTRTPTVTWTPSMTFTPSNTPTPSFTPTPSRTPTASRTPISNCGSVTHGPEVISGTTFSMTINNPTGVALEVLDVTVSWNHDAGHKTGSDKTLRLQKAELAGTFWTGNVYSTSYTIIPTNLTIPTGTSTIIFTFHQTYTQTDGTERIFINIATNGCQLYPIDSNN